MLGFVGDFFWFWVYFVPRTLNVLQRLPISKDSSGWKTPCKPTEQRSTFKPGTHSEQPRPAGVWISHLGGWNYAPGFLNSFMPYFCLHLSVPSLRLGDERAPSRAGAAHRFGGWSRRFASRCRTPCAVKTKGSSFHLAVLGRATTEGKVKKIR